MAIINYHDKLLDLIINYKTTDTKEKLAQGRTLEFIQNNKLIVGKDNKEGHVVASAWIINKDKDKVLMTHHKTLDIWIQLGGHIECGEMPYKAAKREVYEESGLKSIKAVNDHIFDLDVHIIPENSKEKAHVHYDIRYMFQADDTDGIIISHESKDVKWINFKQIQQYTSGSSILRMVEKSKTLK